MGKLYLYLYLFGHSAVVFLCLTDCLCGGVFLRDILLIYSAASLFNKLTYLLTAVLVTYPPP